MPALIVNETKMKLMSFYLCQAPLRRTLPLSQQFFFSIFEYFLGVRFTRLQMETLEEVFKRVHFTEIDLEDSYLDEAVSLFNLLI